MKAKLKWHGIAPGMVYAVTIYAPDRQMAKRELRKFLCLDRLPRGSTVWQE